MRRIVFFSVLLACELMHASGPEFFVNMADPQMGMFAKDQDTLQEQTNLSFVITSINRLKPAFVVVCGDLVNRTGDAEQIKEYKRIMRELDSHIPVYNVAGNHDVGNQPTEQTLTQYRKEFGRDYYTFDSGDVRGIVLNSNLIASPESAPQESAEQEKWLIAELQRARSDGVKQVLIFSTFLIFWNVPTNRINISIFQTFLGDAIWNCFTDTESSTYSPATTIAMPLLRIRTSG